ncbi:hypothetical protein BST24_21975 [Mycobacteroides franklinii]|nr:hypothetical protein BST24_21975 [Mycobacteroides franklinii]
MILEHQRDLILVHENRFQSRCTAGRQALTEPIPIIVQFHVLAIGRDDRMLLVTLRAASARNEAIQIHG